MISRPTQSRVTRPGVPSGPFLVVGLGEAGVAAASALSDSFGSDQVLACDVGRPTGPGITSLRRRGVQVELSSDGCGLLEGRRIAGCVVKSPGVPSSAPVLERARRRGVAVIDELELGWRLMNVPFVGVTGTNGKSTVCALLAAAGRACGVEARIAGNTDFGPPVSALADAPPQWVISEASSFQLEGCTEFLPDVGVLTNLRPEHLGRHGDMRTYASCKRNLFVHGRRSVPVAVVNADDALGRELAEEVAARGGQVLTFGRSPSADYRIIDSDWDLYGAWIDASTPDGRLRLDTRLPGAHNAENVLAAMAAARGLGLSAESTRTAIEQAPGVPGRFEVINEGQPFGVIVDFAHTADALEHVLRAIRRVIAGRASTGLHVVFGDAGNRTPGLREKLGQVVGGLADRLIITEASLRGESLASMVDPVLAGARAAGHAHVELIPERRAAIRRALAGAADGDLVAVLGRGASPTLHPTLEGHGPAFDDRVVVREELRTLMDTAVTSA